jgi:hypothetical protein
MIEMLRPVDHQQKKYQYQKEEKKIGGLDAYPLASPENLSNQSS